MKDYKQININPARKHQLAPKEIINWEFDPTYT